jgi:cyclopropane-fatty-acyl-phospholipid synthase
MYEKSTDNDTFQQKLGQRAGETPPGFAERRAREWLDVAGITPNGNQPWDLQVHDRRLYARVMRQGSLGLGEAYMDGWWDCPELDSFFTKILRARLDDHAHNVRHSLHILHGLFSNMQTKARAWIVGQRHYDLGNRLYECMLDSRMTYTCGYWRNAQTLDQAQEHKLDLVCRKLNLQSGQRVLDIGCGWGSFAKFAAQRYGVQVVGLTISREQAELARQSCAGLPVEIRLQDYREISEPFDHIVSLGMFEHVGWKNYRTYLQVVHRCLRDSGLFLLHTIGSNRTVYGTDPWIDKYIFPNGSLPSTAQIGRASEGLFVTEDWHNFGADYDKTLMAWHANFDAAWPQLSEQFDERFYRMWCYYLLACAGTFRARKTQLWQIVLSKHGVPGGYESIR